MFKRCLVLIFFSLFTIPNLDWKIYLDMFPNIRELAKVESGNKNNPMGNPKALNPKDTDGLPAIGLLQFKEKTFYGWAKQMGFQEANIKNPIHQIIVARWAEDNGLLWHWGPFKRLVREGKIILE